MVHTAAKMFKACLFSLQQEMPGFYFQWRSQSHSQCRCMQRLAPAVGRKNNPIVSVHLALSIDQKMFNINYLLIMLLWKKKSNRKTVHLLNICSAGGIFEVIKTITKQYWAFFPNWSEQRPAPICFWLASTCYFCWLGWFRHEEWWLARIRVSILG